MGFDDDLIALQVIFLCRERDLINTVAETTQFNVKFDIRRLKRLFREKRIDMKLRRNAFLEDRNFKGEVAVAEHAASMRAALEFSWRRGICMLLSSVFVRSAIVVFTSRSDCHANAGKQQSCENECEKLAHCGAHFDEGLMGRQVRRSR
ncbi:MAG: hypothetical protein M5U16_11465 [Hyphomicrobium sp.]|nr:hypothetical protein [Hyphomicrobium sp.]